MKARDRPECRARRLAAPPGVRSAGPAARPAEDRPAGVQLRAAIGFAAALALLPALLSAQLPALPQALPQALGTVVRSGPAVALQANGPHAAVQPFATSAAATTIAASPTSGPLVIVGGGERPPEALARFVLWAGGVSARLMVVTWASAEPRESCDGLLAELRTAAAGASGGAPDRGEPSCAPFAPLDPDGKARRLDEAAKAGFLGQLAAATGVFFSGGDQSRIMDVLSDEELLRAVRDRHARGVVFGGTSAGAAVMSPLMITGEGDFTVINGRQVVVREGLGLLPGVIVDQHFVRRQRENRLFGLVLAHPGLRGVGIDEDTALLVARGGRHAEVVGRGPVLLVDATGPDKLAVTILRSGQSVELTGARLN